jgi:hypothetical protein
MNSRSGKTQTLIISAVIGAIVGAGAGMVLLKRADERGNGAAITGKEGLSIGLLVLGLLRQISQLGDGE